MIMTIDRAKARAKTLRGALAGMTHEVSHSQALDLVAQMEGLRDWNTLSARLAPEVQIGPLPQGWMRSGDQPERFEMGVARRGDQRAAAIRLKPGEDRGSAFGTLMQMVDAVAYRGRRVALEGDLAADEVTGGLTIWLRADAADKQVLAFDNLESAAAGAGPITGDADWTHRRVVLDIPEDAAALNYGFYLRGGGTAWCRGLSLRVVEEDVEVTAESGVQLAAPQNLDFSA
ncbi:glyoxalase superfamily protein [Gymnodinialimonas sp. 2305UL16-5]|uniref:glyoxalase superfamily protein n=1 Tax=Gymnodinialimonas mytili TaxID=3126503 RepID=UPI00309ECBE5